MYAYMPAYTGMSSPQIPRSCFQVVLSCARYLASRREIPKGRRSLQIVCLNESGGRPRILRSFGNGWMKKDFLVSRFSCMRTTCPNHRRRCFLRTADKVEKYILVEKYPGRKVSGRKVFGRTVRWSKCFWPNLEIWPNCSHTSLFVWDHGI